MTNKTIKELDPNFAGRELRDGLEWLDIRALGVEGRAFEDTADYYDRLPAKAEQTVRDGIWQLQAHSAGMCVRFLTDAPEIGVRWTLRFPQLAMHHMPATGMSGVDLYRLENDRYRWAAVGIPGEFPDSAATLRAATTVEAQSFILYLPLYNGVESVQIGVPEDKSLTPAPDWPGGPHKPICFYGTSITQGGCASRPGLSYAAIVERALMRPALNFGFSGNAQAEPELAELLAELDPAVYVLDPLPNIPDRVTERMETFVRILRRAHPDTPILLVESILPRFMSPGEIADPADHWNRMSADLREARENLERDGIGNLHTLEAGVLLGDDFEGTVDGVHPTDAGFLRMAEAFTAKLREMGL